MKYEDFVRIGREFAGRITAFENHETISLLHNHIERNDVVYVITASVEEWIIPYCKQLNIRNVLATKVEVIDGVLTGRFASRNCYGKEKVKRLLAVEPERSSYFLYAYGDSRGDKEMLAFADQGKYM